MYIHNRVEDRIWQGKIIKQNQPHRRRCGAHSCSPFLSPGWQQSQKSLESISIQPIWLTGFDFEHPCQSIALVDFACKAGLRPSCFPRNSNPNDDEKVRRTKERTDRTEEIKNKEMIEKNRAEPPITQLRQTRRPTDEEAHKEGAHQAAALKISLTGPASKQFESPVPPRQARPSECTVRLLPFTGTVAGFVCCLAVVDSR